MKNSNRAFAYLIGTLLINFSTFAIDYKVFGPCSEVAIFAGSHEVVDLNQSIGLISIEIFEKRHIPYIGNENGFNSIINTPTDKDSIEILTPTKLRAYGWCFNINGIIPDTMPGSTHFSNNDNRLNWFYAYSTLDNGKWTDYCVPAFKVKSEKFCKKPSE